MPIPQVTDRIKEAPAVALRAVFAGIGQLLMAVDKIRAQMQEQAASPAAQPPRAQADGTSNLTALRERANPAKPSTGPGGTKPGTATKPATETKAAPGVKAAAGPKSAATPKAAAGPTAAAGPKAAAGTKPATVKPAAVKPAAAKPAAAKPADSTAKPAAGTSPGAATATKP